jgi:DNA-binding response OmpR family regulator
MTTPRILVIDDEQTVRENIVRFLTLEGYRVDAAASGEEGLALARRRTPDLVLCDLMMPGLDGFGVLVRMRAEGATASVPFVFLTGSAEVSDATVAFRLGANEYVTKPFSLPVLGAVVEQRLANASGRSA